MRVLIILFAVCCLGLQIGLFVVAGGVAAAHPHADALHWLYVIDGALMVACFEIALIPLGRVLTLARRRDVFSGEAVHWTNGILACAGAVLVVLLMLSQIWMSPSMLLADVLGVERDLVRFAILGAGLVSLLLIAAFELLMLVMRSLLMQAIERRDELAAVI